jgi:hypothetical protein
VKALSCTIQRVCAKESIAVKKQEEDKHVLLVAILTREVIS